MADDRWVPYTRAPNKCELNCMPRGERFYYRHRRKVVDGTRCDDSGTDVCVDGQCLVRPTLCSFFFLFSFSHRFFSELVPPPPNFLILTSLIF